MTHKIYDMNLHQVINANMDYIEFSGYESVPMEIMRVPGGWLYMLLGKQPIFVAFSNEFQGE